MPNHITNVVSLSGKGADVQKLLASVKSDESEFDFNLIVSMPDELRGTTAPTYIITEEAYARKERGITQKMSNTLKKKYGADNWYEWTRNNWGTKWNAYDVNTYDVGDDTIYFNTAWATPVPILEALSKQHPNVLIHVKYADEDFGHNVGEYKYKMGVLVSENVPDGGSAEAIEMAEDITGGGEYYFFEMPCEWSSIDEVEDNSFYTTILNIIHKRGYVSEDYPKFLLQKLETMAVDDEQYENAKEIRDVLNNLEE
jgi:hypothetical protein